MTYTPRDPIKWAKARKGQRRKGNSLQRREGDNRMITRLVNKWGERRQYVHLRHRETGRGKSWPQGKLGKNELARAERRCAG